jgi:hypothetical protein
VFLRVLRGPQPLNSPHLYVIIPFGADGPMESRMKKVFISSTFVDLIEYRKAAIDVVNRYKCVPISMEFFDSRSGDPETVCDKEITECDLFIGIYAHRYGYIPEGGEKSITHLEYEQAKKEGKDCLCFVVNGKYSWPPDFIEMDKYPKLKTFLKEVGTDNVVSFFESADNFAGKFSSSLGNWLEGLSFCLSPLLSPRFCGGIRFGSTKNIAGIDIYLYFR